MITRTERAMTPLGCAGMSQEIRVKSTSTTVLRARTGRWGDLTTTASAAAPPAAAAALAPPIEASSTTTRTPLIAKLAPSMLKRPPTASMAE
jgi:hypothetical protein